MFYHLPVILRTHGFKECAWKSNIMYRFFMYQFLLEACAAAAQGDKRLAEFCTVHTAEEVQRFLDQAWAVREAPQGSRRAGNEGGAAAGRCGPHAVRLRWDLGAWREPGLVAERRGSSTLWPRCLPRFVAGSEAGRQHGRHRAAWLREVDDVRVDGSAFLRERQAGA